MFSFNYQPCRDDILAAFNIVCTVLGIGSLGMPHDFSQAGPIYTSLALVIMCAVNIYATVALSKCMQAAPATVETFGDLGDFAAGKIGRYVVVVTQFGTCLLVPIAFLILGGATLLPTIFDGVFPHATANMYIPIMAIVLLPVVLIRTLKEAAFVAFIGALGAFFGDAFAVVDSLLHSPFYHNAETKIELGNVLNVFGSMALAYGAAVVIPSIQRDHSRPENMTTVITLCLTGITILYLIIGSLGYYQYGCVSPSDLLTSMSSGSVRTLAYVAFFIHIAIAFAVLLNPALYLFDRNIFHQDDADHYLEAASPKSTVTRASFRWKSYALRTGVVSIQVFIAMLLQGSFSNFADFIGATTITLSCIIIPCAMRLCIFSKQMRTFEKVICWCIIALASILGAYTAVMELKSIIGSVSNFKLFHSAPENLNPTLKTQYCKN